MKVLLLSTFVVILAAYTETQSLQLLQGLYALPASVVNDVDPYCNNAPELYLPHPRDCTKFYRCVANKKIWLTCPSSLYFNAKIEVCDWPSASGCIPGTAPPTGPPTDPPTKPPTKPPTDPPTKPPTDPPTKPPTKPPTDPPTKPPTDPPTKPPTDPPTKPPTKPPTDPPTKPPTNPPSGGCPPGIDMNFHQNLNDCRKYWQCIEGIKNHYTCPLGRYFNPIKVNCVPNNGQCKI